MQVACCSEANKLATLTEVVAGFTEMVAGCTEMMAGFVDAGGWLPRRIQSGTVKCTG